jgi:pyruvate formate lyase activating enzyme
MQIGGLQKNSLIDYPGKLSSVIFCAGCNFDCPYCHNPDLVRGPSKCSNQLNSGMVCGFLDQRRGFLDGVVISGGEPTLQPDLADLCRKIKDLGFPLKLDTNGSRPRVLKGLIDKGLVDYIAMDLKTDPVLYRTFIKPDCRSDPIVASVELIMKSGIDYEFRTTCVKPIVTRRTIENILQLIQGAGLYVLQRFRNSEVLHPEFFQSGDCECGPEALSKFKALADHWVDECIIR